MRSSLQEVEELDHTETEITLGMKSLLGVFFGLVLICGVFFGLGYSLGHGSSSARPSSPAPAASTPATRPLATGPVVHENDGSEPSTYLPGPDAHEPVTSSAAETRASSQSAPSVVKQLTPSPEVKPATASPKPTPAVATSETETPTARPASASLAAAPTQASATATLGTLSMVQIAAVSRQEDAEILVAALKKHGYNAVIRNDPRDSLLHVQIGPFSTRDEARATRAKLLADGYNAILK